MAYNFKIWWVGAYRGMGHYWNEYVLEKIQQTWIMTPCLKSDELGYSRNEMWRRYGNPQNFTTFFTGNSPPPNKHFFGCKVKEDMSTQNFWSFLVQKIVIPNFFKVFEIKKLGIQFCFSFTISRFSILLRSKFEPENSKILKLKLKYACLGGGVWVPLISGIAHYNWWSIWTKTVFMTNFVV